MGNKTIIKTTKTIYPQIYAYTLPNQPEKEGWIKIGYTERQDVDIRIREQTKTAAVNLKYEKLWTEPAKYNQSNKWFKDKQLHQYLRNNKDVKQMDKTEWFFYNGTPEKSYLDFQDFCNQNYSQEKNNSTYQLRFEQEEAVNKTLNYLKEHSGGEFLWNAKPRFGKTLTTYDLIRKINAEKVLIVTNRPAIANSWYDDFSTFIAWQTNFAFVSTSESLKSRPIMSRDEWMDQLERDDAKEKMITFISLQDLKGSLYFGGAHDKLKWVKDLSWDLLVIDESHEGVDTVKTDVAFDNIKRNFTLHLSGTPFKAVASGRFDENQVFNWSYADEQEAKETWNSVDNNNPYEDLPKLNMFSYQMSRVITDEVNKGADIEGENIDFAFDLNEFFETNESGKFIHEVDIKKWLDTLTKNEKYPFSTTELRNELKHTFWLLQRVASAKALEKLLKEHPVFENYKIILAAGDGRLNTDDQIINQKSLDRVRKEILENDKTITLSVGQLTTGVTVPEWTAVMMLSNMKSPSLYMQAAFRAQNPWDYEENGVLYKKENAYVFDFAPERTLIVYDEFANDLSQVTTNGSGTSEDRKKNIRKLLNFFPVIAEDTEGKMVKIDVDQVLTIPKVIKAQEVVKRGFMSNLLFQNISGIFASAGAREILENLNPVDIGKVTPRKTEAPINTLGIEVDDEGEVSIDKDIVIATNQAHFGEKVYKEIQTVVEDGIEKTSDKLSRFVSKSFTENTQDTVRSLAKENGLTTKFADKIVEQSSNIIAREIDIVQKKTDILQAEAKIEYDKIIAVAEAYNNEEILEEAKQAYEAKRSKIKSDFNKKVMDTVVAKSKDLTEKSTETVLKKVEDKKKNTVEDDIRARLRGFARTIPSFLMAYGELSTTLNNFDMTIKDNVFQEVTGITLEQFRSLRDIYNFFDEIVFNESIQEFLRKKIELANYFEDFQEEDIFDYIPPQQTNQIFTPKKVVEMMVDKLKEEDPDCFSNRDRTFADLYMKSGLYITEIVKRLYVGLESQIPDNDERLKHILEKQVYGFAPSEIIYNISRNFIFGFDSRANNINDSHIVFLDTTPFARGETSISFEEKCDELFGGNN